MYSRLTRKQLVIIIVASLLSITLLVFAITVSTKNTTPPTPSTIVQLDSGLSALLNRGITSDQLSDTKYAFTQFAKQKNKPVKSLLLDTSSIRHNFDPSSGIENFQFTIKDWGGNKINAQVDTVDLSAAKLTLTNSSNKPVFTSEVIDLRASGVIE